MISERWSAASDSISFSWPSLSCAHCVFALLKALSKMKRKKERKQLSNNNNNLLFVKNELTRRTFHPSEVQLALGAQVARFCPIHYMIN